MIHINEIICSACGECARACPLMVITCDPRAAVTHPESCISCYHCVAICAKAAITCDEFPLSAFKPIRQQKNADKKFDQLVRERRSIRCFQDKPVPPEMLASLLKSAAHAPTGHNAQGVNLTVITQRQRLDEIEKDIFALAKNGSRMMINPITDFFLRTCISADFADQLAGDVGALSRYERIGTPMILRNAPVLIVAHTDITSPTGKDDAVIALDQLSLLAQTQGLGATWLGFVFGAAKINHGLKSKLEIPPRHEVHSAIVLGWPDVAFLRTIPRKPLAVAWGN